MREEGELLLLEVVLQVHQQFLRFVFRQQDVDLVLLG